MVEVEALQVGDLVRCDPSSIEGVVYAISPGVIYVRLAKGEIITSPADMLHPLDPLCERCHRRHQPSAGHFGERALSL